MASKTKSIWLLLVGSALLVGGLAAYVRFTPAREVPADLRRPATVSQNGRQPAEVQKVLVLHPRYQDNDLKFDQTEASVPAGEDKVVFAVNQFLDKASFVAKEVRLRSVKVEKGMATLDFSEAFATSYGTDDERTVVNGILTAVGQFPEIETVKFLANGKPIDSLGNIELTDPQPVLRP